MRKIYFSLLEILGMVIIVTFAVMIIKFLGKLL
jgi:hypothetical protein